jgi:hypothetical protein
VTKRRNTFRVASTDDLREATVYICTPKTDPLYLPDNLLGHCSKCWQMVQFRPNTPRELIKICIHCAAPQMMKASKAGKLDVAVTPEQAAEFAAYLRKKDAN